MLLDMLMNILTILSFILAVISIIRMKMKVLQVNLLNNKLVNKEDFQFPKLKFSYNEESVEKLTASKVIFWNNSFSEIKNEDIPEAAPLTISLKDGKIIDASVLKGNETSNKVSISYINDTCAKITFDYLNRKEGGIIQVMHTGDEDSINISGKIIGGKIKTSQERHSIIHKFVHMGLTALYAYLAFLIFAIFIPPNMINETRRLYLETVPEKYGAINVQNIIFLIVTIMLSSVIIIFQEKVIDFTPTNCRYNKEIEK